MKPQTLIKKLDKAIQREQNPHTKMALEEAFGWAVHQSFPAMWETALDEYRKHLQALQDKEHPPTPQEASRLRQEALGYQQFLKLIQPTVRQRQKQKKRRMQDKREFEAKQRMADNGDGL